MSIENSSVLKVAALGRPFQLGMLYDFSKEKLISDAVIWNEGQILNYTKCRSALSRICEVHTEDTFMKKADLLGMDANLKMSTLFNSVGLLGSARLMTVPKASTRQRRFILKYSVTTHFCELDMVHLGKTNPKYEEIYEQKIATHVVTGIQYGAEVYIIFDRTSSNDENQMNIDKSVMQLLEKLTKLEVFDNGELKLKGIEKNIAESLTCQYYGDFELDFSPKTFQKAAQLFKDLPKLLGENQENTIPKQVSMYPLFSLHNFRLIRITRFQASDDTVTKSLEVIDRLYQLVLTINDLKNTLPPTTFFHQNELQLVTISDCIKKFESTMKMEMKKLWQEIRSGAQEEIVLVNLVKNIDLFSIGKHQINSWIQSITEGLRILVYFFDVLGKQININITSFQYFQDTNNINYEFILILIIHVMEKNDPFLNNMFKYLNIKTSKRIDRTEKSDYWYTKENLSLIRNKVTLFSEFAEINKQNQNIKFIAGQQYADDFEMQKDVTVILYHQGATTKFSIPSKPGQPYLIKPANQNETLVWSKPKYGSQSIQQYKIYERMDPSLPWKICLTTVDATPFVIVTNLFKGKHQFKVQGITLVGDTAFSDVSDFIDINMQLPIVPAPTPKPMQDLAIIIVHRLTKKKAILDVVPGWFKPIRPILQQNIRLPETYNNNSPIDTRTYSCLSAYRAMVKKTEYIDFVADPFLADIDNTETLIVILNELAHQLGARLSFTRENFSYDSSDYRTACGVTDFGSIHSFLAAEGYFQTAKFNLYFKTNYDDIVASMDLLSRFLVTVINDVAKVLKCRQGFIRVFSVSKTPSVLVELGITTIETAETIRIAEYFKKILNESATVQRSDILQYLSPEKYEYRLESALGFLQLQESDFDPCYNRNFRSAKTEIRGGFPYYFPQGWYRYALRVDDKYPDDEDWLGVKNHSGGWTVAYHGINADATRSVRNKGLLPSFVSQDIMKEEAKRQNPSIPDTRGLYVTTHCEGGASLYSSLFKIQDSYGNKKTYKLGFQCRIQPGRFTQHKELVQVGMAWRVFDEKAIRPYGILLKNS